MGAVLGALTLWYGSPEVKMILPSCLATCAGGRWTGEGRTGAGN